jgi:hypothetical protein
MLINNYYPGIAFQNFPGLDDKINARYDKLYDTVLDCHISPRYVYEHGLRIGFRDIFYYIDQLYTNNPTTVIDVGSGECIWKEYFPNIIGFDPNINEFSQQDFVDYFDKDFSENHTAAYTCGMALNSIHFIPWNEIKTQIDLAMNIVTDRFLFTFNFQQVRNKPAISTTELVYEFKKIIDSLDYSIILFDSPLLRGVSEENMNNLTYINGTVRFILEHKK